MYNLLLILHLLICLALVGVVLLQSGKGGGLAGGAFGGTAQTVFGGRGATDFMTRATMVLGAAFFVSSLVLSMLASGAGRASRSLIQEEAKRSPAVPSAPRVPGQGTPAPTTPAPTAPAPGGSTTPPAGGTTPPGGGHR